MRCAGAGRLVSSLRVMSNRADPIDPSKFFAAGDDGNVDLPPDFEGPDEGNGVGVGGLGGGIGGLCDNYKAPPREFRPSEVRVEDGTGNVSCVFRADDSGIGFEYFPITPMQSSSGHYSGGKYVEHTGRLNDEEFADLQRAVDAAAADTEAHAPQRSMGTWRISIAGNEERTLLRMNSAHTEMLQRILSDFKQRS